MMHSSPASMYRSYYPDFTDENRQKVWKTFIDKLEKDRSGSMRVPIGTKEYLQGNEVKSVKWNGRQIRNGKYSSDALGLIYKINY